MSASEGVRSAVAIPLTGTATLVTMRRGARGPWTVISDDASAPGEMAGPPPGDVVLAGIAACTIVTIVGVACDVLVDRVVRVVSSLAADVSAALAADVSAALAATSAEGEAALIELRERNRRLFNRLMLVVASAYYLSTDVRERIGYRGQEAKKLDFFEVPAYLEDGTLDRVIERGPRWIDVAAAPGSEGRSSKNGQVA